ncbi:MAG: hypothetical protein ACMV0I_06375 [Pseudomonas sp.]
MHILSRPVPIPIPVPVPSRPVPVVPVPVPVPIPLVAGIPASKGAFLKSGVLPRRLASGWVRFVMLHA